MQGTSAVLNVMTLPPGATKTQTRIVIDGVRGAIFEYAAGGPVGALVSSWARTAGTDPYGNAYPAGFSAGSGSEFAGTNFVINSAGYFEYSGTPAAGNLIYSVTSATGHDAFNNNYLAGVTSYNNGLFNASNIFNGSFGFYDSPTGNPNAVWTARGSINQLAVPGPGIQIQVGNNPNGLELFNAQSLGTALLNASAVSGALSSSPLDGNKYFCGVNYNNTRVNAVVNSVTFAALKSIPVEAGVLYNVRAILVYSGNQAAGLPQFSFSHGGIGGSITDAVGFTQVDGANIGVWLDAGISDRNGPTLDTAGHYMLWEMTFTAPSTGNLVFSVAASVAADTWNAKALDVFLRALN